jgi:hypothetical protein
MRTFNTLDRTRLDEDILLMARIRTDKQELDVDEDGLPK